MKKPTIVGNIDQIADGTRYETPLDGNEAEAYEALRGPLQNIVDEREPNDRSAELSERASGLFQELVTREFAKYIPSLPVLDVRIRFQFEEDAIVAYTVITCQGGERRWLFKVSR